MSEIRIFNKRTYARKDHPHSKAFYCGRPMRDLAGSPLKNPSRISGTVNRAQAIAEYQVHFHGMTNNRMAKERDEFMQALADICIAYQSGQDVDLLCWCSPDAKGNIVPCHCGIIRDYVLKVTSL